ncbi:hypothetical protein [Streptomyces collinus]|uniref:hypothetical protein n=2 Tax=Streptomyces collinus TaxID=42684 RepID=UPI003819C319
MSTGDLARPADPGTGSRDEAGMAAPSSAPIYPGESTGQPDARPPGDEPGGAAADRSAATGSTGSPAGSDTTEPVSGTSSQPHGSGASDEEMPQLLTDGDEQGFRDRWQRIQSRFVDDPQEAVHDADALVADVMQTLATTFDQHKKDLEGQWDQGARVDTEELRGALRHYRSFFNRLLST